MAKVIITIAPENGMCMDRIMSFKTDNYIGIWDTEAEKFALMKKSSKYFEPWYISFEDGSGFCEALKELDEAVYEKCEEHITDVFDKSNYTIELI